MGFYGNITYNTYGLQEKGVKPEHLDRSYWRCSQSSGIYHLDGLRAFLDLPITSDENIWANKWNEAKNTIFKFHFAPEENNEDTEQKSLRRLFGSGMLIGWVREVRTNYFLYALSFGDKTGQIFQYEIIPNRHKELVLKGIDECALEKEWDNGLLLDKTIITSQLCNSAVTKEKISKDAVTEEKIENGAVTTDKINDADVVPSKLDRGYWEKTLLGTISTYTDLFSKCTKITGNQNLDDVSSNGTLCICGSLRLPLPALYSNESDQNNFIQEISPYDIGRCLIWHYNDTIYVISESRGQIWKIDKKTSIQDGDEIKYVFENDTYYLPTLTQMITPAIKEGGVIPEKLDRSYLEKQVLWQTGLNWPDLYQQMEKITTLSQGNQLGGTIYFIKELSREQCLPQKYKNLDPNNKLIKLQHCIAWRTSDKSILLYSFNYGQTWYIKQAGIRNTSNIDDVEITEDQVKFLVNDDTVEIYAVELKEISTPMIQKQSVKGEHLDINDTQFFEGVSSMFDVLLYKKMGSGTGYFKSDLQNVVGNTYIEGDLYGDEINDLFSDLYSKTIRYIGIFTNVKELFEKVAAYDDNGNLSQSHISIIKYARSSALEIEGIDLPNGIYLCVKNTNSHNQGQLILSAIDFMGTYCINFENNDTITLQNLNTQFVSCKSEQEIKNLLMSNDDIVPYFFLFRGELWCGISRENPSSGLLGPTTCLKSRHCSTGKIAYLYYVNEGEGRIATASASGNAFGCQGIGDAKDKPTQATTGQIYFSTSNNVLYICTQSSGPGVSAYWQPVYGYRCKDAAATTEVNE